MIFVTIKNDVVLFDPASIDIFLPYLIRFFFPCFRCFSGFYFFVFLTGISLPGSLNNAGINNLAWAGKDTLVIKRLIETIDEWCNNLFQNKGFTKLPDGLAISFTLSLDFKPRKRLKVSLSVI